MDNKNPLENLVEKLGGFDELSKEERDVYFNHLKIMEGKTINVDDVKTFIRNLILNIERELVDAEEGTPRSLGLKARLKNMLVIESFLFSPERAKRTIENYYSNIKL